MHQGRKIMPLVGRFCQQMASHVPIMMKGDAVELLKRIRHLTIGCRKTRIHRHPLHLARAGPTDVDTRTLLDIAEVEGIRATTLVGDHRRLHMPNKRPLGLPEEGMGLDVRCARSSSKALGFVLDQQFAN